MSLPTRVNRSGSAVLDPIENAQREFDSLLGQWFGNRQSNGGAFAPFSVDIREDADHLYVEADLPGFKKEEIDVTLENQTLAITAQRSVHQKDEKKGELLLNERRYTRFQRSFTLPPTIDEQTVQAKLTDGVLTVVLNKREETKPRKIAVG